MHEIEKTVRSAVAGRIAAGDTPYAIATRAGMSPIAVSRFLNGKDVYLTTASKIVEACRNLQVERGTMPKVKTPKTKAVPAVAAVAELLPQV